MDERAIIARLHRRLGFGLASGELEAAVPRGIAAERARIFDRSGAPPEPFAGLDLTYELGKVQAKVATAIDAWVNTMVSSPAGLVERTAWTWHGILVSSSFKVKAPYMMTTQVGLFRSIGLDSYGTLLEAIAKDQAMLVYLDGNESSGTHPNENFSRELLELFTVGVGNYTEADVEAGARALTGWRTAPRKDAAGVAALRPKDHDDTPQRYLDASNVHDIASVVAAVTARPELATYVSSRFAREMLGPKPPAAVASAVADRFRSSGLSVQAMAEAIADRLMVGEPLAPVVSAPVPWLVMALRATGARPKSINGLKATGQMPLSPPNVGGWPSGAAWNSSATLVGRANLAAAIAAATPPGSPALAAATAGDWPALSLALGLPAEFGANSVAGFSMVRDGLSRLALALVSPEFVEV
jgi:uncharacterized protein (DUF1800 family)